MSSVPQLEGDCSLSVNRVSPTGFLGIVSVNFLNDVDIIR
jgi:hypothetical protein